MNGLVWGIWTEHSILYGKNYRTLNLQGKNYQKLNLSGCFGLFDWLLRSFTPLLDTELNLFILFRLAIKYIRHLQFLLASPPGSTVDFEATNFSLDPLPSWRSMGLLSASSTVASTSSDLRPTTSSSYDFPTLLLRHSQQQNVDLGATSSRSMIVNIQDADQPSFKHSVIGAAHPFSCTYEEASPLNWNQQSS